MFKSSNAQLAQPTSTIQEETSPLSMDLIEQRIGFMAGSIGKPPTSSRHK